MTDRALEFSLNPGDFQRIYPFLQRLNGDLLFLDRANEQRDEFTSEVITPPNCRLLLAVVSG